MTAVAHPLTPSTRTAVRPDARELRYQRFGLRIIAGPETGREVTSAGTSIAIGTAPGNDLVLVDRTVSRHHCEISVGERGFLLRDLESTNGTTVGGVRIATAYLEAGTVIGVGGASVRFEVHDDEVREPLSVEGRFGTAIGESAAMRRVFAVLARAAGCDASVLLEGETGTGKGLVAEAIHQASPRAARPLVVVDCGSLPPTLIESELFGHARGAFTDAREHRIGAFESAQGGTVFLDEIGELPLEMQPKLLRALDSRVIRAIGSTRNVPLDVRIIAATNRDLREEVNRGRFRADLFYRLNVVRVRIPALRERREDIPLLAAHFYRRLSREPDPTPPPELLSWLMQHHWPGNVRELRAAIERAILLGDDAGGVAEASGGVAGARGAATPSGEVSFHDAKQHVIDAWERDYLRALMRQFGGNLSRAGQAVSIDRNHLRLLLSRHGIDKRKP
jgi:two-component system response regulator GlrR